MFIQSNVISKLIFFAGIKPMNNVNVDESFTALSFFFHIKQKSDKIEVVVT